MDTTPSQVWLRCSACQLKKAGTLEQVITASRISAGPFYGWGSLPGASVRSSMPFRDKILENLVVGTSKDLGRTSGNPTGPVGGAEF
jgi:hypothetical protein